MLLERLQIQGVRNLESVRLDPLALINVLYGDNGAGKTSVLEAIHILGLARSFRNPQIKPVINYQQSECTVFGRLSGVYVEQGGTVAMGVTRDRQSQYKIRINGLNVSSTAELAEYLPLLTINADSFDLLTGAPASRRRYLDWSVFHVEPSFYSQWKRYQRCIKQRNSVLRRDKIDSQQLSTWTKELVYVGEEVDRMRQQQFSKLAQGFLALANQLTESLEGIELRYHQGWDKEKSLDEALEQTLSSDMERGFTHVGPHRADLKIRLGRVNAVDVLSRGQIKLAVCALKLAQGRLLGELTGRKCVYLIDDLPSELDDGHLTAFCQLLEGLGSQVFVTCVDRHDLLDKWSESAQVALFHVEHGQAVPI